MNAKGSPDFLADFVNRHGLRTTSRVEAETTGIHWANRATALLNEGFVELSDEAKESEPAVGMVLNLLHRAYEHLEAGLVAYATVSPASSEALSRVTMELAVSISYMLMNDRDTRLFSFLRNYILIEEKRLRNWEQATKTLSEEGKEHQLAAIGHRRSGIEVLSAFLDSLRPQLEGKHGHADVLPWPSVASRFEALGLADAYRTVYSRTSSQIHVDAEETIRYFLAVMSPDESLRERMALESWAFSRYMLYFAVKYYLMACGTFALTYGMKSQLRPLNDGIKIIDKELHELVKYVD